MIYWSIEKIILDLKYTWKIARNASDRKTNLLVKVSDERSNGSGEGAPNIRYGESPEQLVTEFDSFLSHKPEEIKSLIQLDECIRKSSLSNALKFAIDSAYVHYACAAKGISVCRMFDIDDPPLLIPTSYSIPLMEIGAMKEFYDIQHLDRFPFIKIKIDADSGTDAIHYLSRFCSQPLLVDANEAFHDVEQCIFFMEKIKKKQIEFVEQPMPSTLVDESLYLKKYSPFRLFADESITSAADFGSLKKMFDGVNIKLMKAGGYLNGIRLLREAKKHQLKTMIGCMVETTLAISSAMHLASLADYVDLDSFLLVKNEPFGLVEEQEGKLTFKKNMV